MNLLSILVVGFAALCLFFTIVSAQEAVPVREEVHEVPFVKKVASQTGQNEVRQQRGVPTMSTPKTAATAPPRPRP